MTVNEQNQNEQSNPMADAPAWAIQLMQQVESLKERTDRIKAQQEEWDAQREQRLQAQQPQKTYIKTAFGEVEDTPQNRALIKTDTDHLTNFDPIAEMQKDKANDHLWARVRAAHAAFMAEQDQNRVLTPDEQMAKDAAKERAKEAIGSRMRVFGSDEAFWK